MSACLRSAESMSDDAAAASGSGAGAGAGAGGDAPAKAICGVYGLSVMGQNLALNIASKGFRYAP